MSSFIDFIEYLLNPPQWIKQNRGDTPATYEFNRDNDNDAIEVSEDDISYNNTKEECIDRNLKPVNNNQGDDEQKKLE